MKVIVIGASGTIGRAIVEELAPRHEIVTVGRTNGQVQADITKLDSVHAMFDKIGKADAVVVAAGSLHFGTLADVTPEQLNIGLQDKLMGQVNVALAAQRYLNDGGSITLTSGIVAEQPIRYGTNASMVNCAVEGFVRGAAIELSRGLRINVVSPNVLQESMEAYGPYFIGFEAVPAKRAALAYARSVDGLQTGQVYKVF
jgi:NAD(P)-dependent dehydrogenase (short-subunit alcohol dehydrogenase family)